MPRAFLLGVLLAILCGCGLAQPGISAPGAPPLDGPTSTLSKMPLLYAGAWLSSGGGLVQMLSYPDGRLVGTLYGISRPPLSLCSDQAGNVYITLVRLGRFATFYKFAHGATYPSETLNDPGDPAGCAVDPVTGDVAVANANSEYYGHGDGNVAVFRNGSGNAQRYTDKQITTFVGCGYDDAGNLLVGGLDRKDQYVLLMLKQHRRAFTKLTLDKPLGALGPIEWDGRYFTVGYATPHKLYRIAVSGSTAKVMGTTRLAYRKYKIDGEYWIFKGTAIAVIGPKEHAESSIGFWKYPSGGTPSKVLRRSQRNMIFTGLTISSGTAR